jgi:DNA-binding CsgD family transcriptional regulator
MDVLGRETELGRIDAWLRSASEDGPEPISAGTLLVIEGQPGIGKTTLWAEAILRARSQGWHVFSCCPAPSEAGLSHVGLADLLRSAPDDVFESLPPPQRRPLDVALLREEAGAGDLDPRAVGTGLAALLRVLADREPLMLAVDDAQWLDPASARSLAFALRRVTDRRVRALAAVRIDGDPQGTPQRRSVGFAVLESSLDRQAVQRVQVGPLSVAAIHQMFRGTLGTSFPRPVLVRIHQSAGGNPFYALEVAREINRIGIPAPGQPLPVPGNHRDLALLRLRRLPAATREILAVVSATPRPTVDDLDLEALAPAERAGMVAVRPGGRVEFTHPLFGSSLYSSLREGTRRGLHRALAGKAMGLEERARHLALAAHGPDEATAEVLDRAADAAGARGAADMAVELKELACQLTPPQARQALVRRQLELADRRYFAGDPNGARRELERSAHSLPSGEDRAQVLLELGSVLWTQCEGDEGIALMSKALGEATTPSLRARIHSRISSMADDCDVAVEHGEAALALLDESADPLLYSFALHNVALKRLYAGRGADHEAIERGMRLQREAAAWEVSTVPAYWAGNFDDYGTARQRFEDLLRVFTDNGDEASSCGVLAKLAVIEARTGRMDRARALAAEALDLAGQTEQETYVMVALNARGQVCAHAGELAEARAAAGEMLQRLERLPDATLEGMARAVLGLVALSAGDLAEADRQLSRTDSIVESQHAREPAADRFHADHAEAVIGLGDLERAAGLVARMEARARILPRPWILAVSARSSGMLNSARGDLAEAFCDYQVALEAHQTLEMPIELARTQLAVGRLHRRRNERQRAQVWLGEAARGFESAGALGWAAVAHADLHRAAGRRGDSEHLTATEREIAELAGSGFRNHEIAARLFLSRKTVEANLSRAYRKLGIRSRAELARRLAAQPGSESMYA